MLIGYARVSTEDQNLDLQRDALARAGCGRIFEDRRSGAKTERPGLLAALDYARAGDGLVVWRLDRLGRSLKDLIAFAERLEQRKVGLRSLKEALDTTSSGGRCSTGCSSAGMPRPSSTTLSPPSAVRVMSILVQ